MQKYITPARKANEQRLHDLATQLLKVQAMTKSQNYLLHIVSQIPSSESPLNALLTRQNIEEVNEQTSETTRMVRDDITELKERISEFPLQTLHT
jgi:DNA-binding FrmR family transcriptional regulator